MTTLHVAAIQRALSDDRDANVAALTEMVREAAAGGAEVILLPELFEGHYFPQRQSDAEFARARPLSGHPTIAHFAALAGELEVCLPISFFERAGQSYYNSAAVIDRRGEILGVYRKIHIPDGPGYQEKFYFRPGDTGFRVWPVDDRDSATVGVGVCWDQWFPEAARAMVLDGADVLFYPTAIGSEPAEPDADTRDRWQRVMIGHAVANVCAVVAANRTGVEGDIEFYGSSFIADFRGDKLAELDRSSDGIASAVIDLDEQRRERANWGFFRDRRPDCYTALSRTREPES
jgi:N-carbamoylputrescine amidase